MFIDHTILDQLPVEEKCWWDCNMRPASRVSYCVVDRATFDSMVKKEQERKEKMVTVNFIESLLDFINEFVPVNYKQKLWNLDNGVQRWSTDPDVVKIYRETTAFYKNKYEEEERLRNEEVDKEIDDFVNGIIRPYPWLGHIQTTPIKPILNGQ